MRAVRNWLVAIESGWRAGVRQFRKRRTELAKADQYQREAIADARTNNEPQEDMG